MTPPPDPSTLVVTLAGPRRTWRASTPSSATPPENENTAGGKKDEAKVEPRTTTTTGPSSTATTTTHHSVEDPEVSIEMAARLTRLRASIADLKRQLAMEVSRRQDAEQSLVNTENAIREATAREGVEPWGEGGDGLVGPDGGDGGVSEEKENAGPRRLDGGRERGTGEGDAMNGREGGEVGGGGGGEVLKDARDRAKRANKAAADLEAAVASERQRLKRLQKEVKVRLKKLREEGERGDKATAGIEAAKEALVKAKSQAFTEEAKARDSAPAIRRELEKKRGATKGGEVGVSAADREAMSSTRATSAARAELDVAEEAVAKMRRELNATRAELERARQDHLELEQTAGRLEEAAACEEAERSGLVSPVDGAIVRASGGTRGAVAAAEAAEMAAAAAEAAEAAANARVEAGAARAAAAAAAARLREVEQENEEEARAAAADLAEAYFLKVVAEESENRRRVASLAARARSQQTRMEEVTERIMGAGGTGINGGGVAVRKAGTMQASGKKTLEDERDEAAAAAQQLAALISVFIEAQPDTTLGVQLNPPPLNPRQGRTNGNLRLDDAVIPHVCKMCRFDPYVDASIVSCALGSEGSPGVEALRGIVWDKSHEVAEAQYALEALMTELKADQERISSSIAEAKTRCDADVAYANELSRDLADARHEAALARNSATIHARRFASSEDYDREVERGETAAASLVRVKEDIKHHKERIAANKAALADLDAAIHSKLVEHIRRERAVGAVKEEAGAISRELAAARRLLHDHSDLKEGSGSGKVYDRLGGTGGDPQWRRVRELDEELGKLKKSAEEGRRELRRAERDVELAEARISSQRGEAVARETARLRAVEQAASRARKDAEEAAREEREAAEAAAAAAGQSVQRAAELAELEAQVRATRADVRYLTAWRDKHAPKQDLGTSPVVVVDIQPGVGEQDAC